MMYNNAEISKLFQEESIHVLDYDMEYDTGIPCFEKFPEYDNKIWKFFNTDSGMATGHFTFGDLESGATMNLKVNFIPFLATQIRILFFLARLLDKFFTNSLVQDYAYSRRFQISSWRTIFHLQLRRRDHSRWSL